MVRYQDGEIHLRPVARTGDTSGDDVAGCMAGAPRKPVFDAPVALPIKAREAFTAPVTVLLEPVWVLKSRDCSAEQVAFGLNALLDLPNFKPERAYSVRDALRNYAAGLGFSDALHLALNAGDQHSLTFDKAFAQQAKKMTSTLAVVLV